MSSENKLKLIDPENSSLTVEERKELDTKIQQLIEAHKGQRQEINRLTFESISAMATGDDYARELANKGWLRTLGGNITGSNKRLQDKINSSRAAAQYATQQTLQRLAEQNLLTVDLISEINKKLNISIVTVEGEVNEIYQTLIAIFKKSNVDVQELSGRIDEQQEKYQQLKQQMNSRCEACGASLSEKQTVCFQCGAIQKLKVKDMPDEIILQVNKLSQAIQKIVQARTEVTDHSWSEESQKYADILSAANALTGPGMSINISSALRRQIGALVKRCKTAEFQIALVGAVKAGKSMLMNALIGADLASVGVNSETAALTKFRSAPENYVEVTFYTQAKWERLKKSAQASSEMGGNALLDGIQKVEKQGSKEKWIGQKPLRIPCKNMDALRTEIQRWTSAQSEDHFLAAEVEVGIERSHFDMPQEVVFVDTPGLHDPVAYRSEITEKYIASANAVLIVVAAAALHSETLATITKAMDCVGSDKKKAYIVATQVDRCNTPEEYDTILNGKGGWVDLLTRAGRYQTRKEASSHICGTSAYLQLCLNSFLRNGDLNDDDYFNLETYCKKKFREKYGRSFNLENLKDNPKLVDELTSDFGISLLRNRLDRTLIQQYRELLLQDIRKNYQHCKSELQQNAKKAKMRQEALLRTAQAGAEAAQQEVREKEAELQRLEKLQKEISGKLTKLKHITGETIDKIRQS